MAGSFSIGQSLLLHHNLHANKSPSSSFKNVVSCSLNKLSTKKPYSDDNKEKDKEVKSKRSWWMIMADMGRQVKGNLSPKQKGDWKDVFLMSLSFAVYIYISQRIVCAYCAWMSIINRF